MSCWKTRWPKRSVSKPRAQNVCEQKAQIDDANAHSVCTNQLRKMAVAAVAAIQIVHPSKLLAADCPLHAVQEIRCVVTVTDTVACFHACCHTQQHTTAKHLTEM